MRFILWLSVIYFDHEYSLQMNIIQCGTEIAMINGFGLTVDEFTELLRHQDSSPLLPYCTPGFGGHCSLGGFLRVVVYSPSDSIFFTFFRYKITRQLQSQF